MDKFEKHIRDNKAQFEEHKADRAKLWANIESVLNSTESKPKVVRLWQSPMFKIAASIVVVVGIFTLINISSINNTKQNVVVNQELNDIDMHYQGLVAYQVKLVNKNTKLSSEEKKEFLSFIDDLDKEYAVLKLELQKNLDSERILEAIVINYKKRIELIENLLKQVNSSEKTENSHEYVL
ncbi:hypothetical protein [Mariniflexile sp. HMF6888]|uniref:hypothetical protein n=1 Tax=Mariniflexile sp. HMF6888 TaxID=3373086 RepID=UPI00378A0113